MRRVSINSSGNGFMALLLIYCLGLVTLFSVGAHVTSPAAFPLGGPGDYIIFYTAGLIINGGDAGRLYDPLYQSQVQQQVLAHHGLSTHSGLLPYNYPPSFALPFVLLSRLSLPDSFLLWYGLNLALIGLATGLLLNDLRSAWRRHLVPALLLVVSFQPTLFGLINGQSSPVMLLLLTISFLAMKQRRDGLAGAALALALLKPQFALPMALIFLYLHRWRSLLMFALVASLLLLFSGLVVGYQGLVDYASMLRYSMVWTGQPGFYAEVMPSVRGSVVRFAGLAENWTDLVLPASWQMIATVTITLAGLAFMVWLWRQAQKTAPYGFAIAYAASIGLTLLLSPHVYLHDLILLVIAAFAIFGYCNACNQPRMGRNMIALGHLTPWLAFLLLSPAAYAQFMVLGLIAMVAILAVLLWRSVPVSSRV